VTFDKFREEVRKLLKKYGAEPRVYSVSGQVLVNDGKDIIWYRVSIPGVYAQESVMPDLLLVSLEGKLRNTTFHIHVNLN